MRAQAFQELAAYRLAAELSDELWQEVLAWKSFERWSVGLQLVRAADSVAANIAEACGRWHYSDQRRLLYVARGSLLETQHWLSRATARCLLHDKQYDRRTDEIRRLINGLVARREKRLG